MLASLCLLFTAAAQAASPGADGSLRANTGVSTEGYFVLNWEMPADTEASYELQQADNAGFRDAVSTAIPARGNITLSGFRDGDYYFRVGDGQQWTETVTVTVAHPSLARALLFFLLGFILFIALIVSILIGHYRHPMPASEPGATHD